MPAVADALSEFQKLDPKEQGALFFEFLLSRAGAQKFPVADYPGIVKTPAVCGGAARIIRTRIPVWTLERMRQLGISESDILRSFPSLRAIDLVQAWGYAEAHADEISQLVRENEEE